MANPQLTAYVSAQLDKGVTREAITQALIGAGWMQADVESAVAEVAAQRSGTMNVAVTPGTASANPTVTVSQVQPATSPSSPQTVTTVTATTAPVTAASTTVTPASFFATTPMTSSMGSEVAEPKKSLTWLFVLVGILLALGIIGGLAYAFVLNGAGAADGLTDGSANAQELATVQQERDQLRADASSMAENIKGLENELSLFQTSNSPTLEITIRGTLSTTTTGWILTTPRNVVVTVGNAKDAGVAAALAPLAGAEAEITGTHAPQSAVLKVTAVNGTQVTAPAAAAPAATTTAPAAPKL